MCWRNDDFKRIFLCDGCEAEAHSYCVQPPLLSVPGGELWPLHIPSLLS